MAAPPIPLGLIGTGLAVEKPHRPALRGPADRAASLARDDLRHARAPRDGDAIGRLAFNHVFTGGAIGNYTAS